MLTKPRFKPHFHVEVVESDTVYLLSEHTSFALSGHLYTQLAPLLDGRFTVGDLLQYLQDQVPTLAVLQALERLERKGFLTEAEDRLPPQMAAFWSSLGGDCQTVADRLETARVAVLGLGAVATEPFVTALESLNLRVSDAGDITVVLTDNYLHPELEGVNQQALQTGKPWMLVNPVGTVLWIGPIFRPGQTGCWQCLAQRLQDNREVETAIQRQKGLATPLTTARSLLPTHLQIGLNLAATEVARWLVFDHHEQLQGQLTTLDLTTLSTQQHEVVKRPQCAACGDPSADIYCKPKPIHLQARPKQFIADGGHRSVGPEETFQAYRHHISPITGVIRSLHRFETHNPLIHVYGATHKSRDSLDSLANLRRGLRRTSAGKGKTDAQSKTSALCEAIERYSGLFTGEAVRIAASYEQLGSQAIHPNAWMQFSQRQYQQRQAWNSQHGSFAQVPEPFDETQVVDWTPVWSLTHQTFRYLPTACCYFNYPFPDQRGFSPDDSNGSAAGNTLEEAILQGFMELVERDSVALWWYNRVPRPAVDLESFNDPYLQALGDYYHTRQRELWVLDITSDLAVPTFAAVSRRCDQAAEQILMGFGAHFDPQIALLRAVTELNQTSLIELQQSQAEPDAPDLAAWFATATLANQPYLVPAAHQSPKTWADYPQRWNRDLRQDVLACVELAAHHGLETLVLDQTRPDIGLPVVKVFVPGLRHFWPRFAAGRLYDVPVKLGWLPAPLAEADLNPIPMFL